MQGKDNKGPETQPWVENPAPWSTSRGQLTGPSALVSVDLSGPRACCQQYWGRGVGTGGWGGGSRGAFSLGLHIFCASRHIVPTCWAAVGGALALLALAVALGT